MASFQQYRNRILERNPSLQNLDTRMTMLSGEFLRHLERAYECGASDARAACAPSTNKPFSDIFSFLNPK